MLDKIYSRQVVLWGEEGQNKLRKSVVAVVGCGGLGGFVIESLARLGVGKIIAIDPEVFEESNLNRQILSRLDNLGRPKVEEALKRVQEINPEVQLIPIREKLSEENVDRLILGANVVVDALDNIPSRRILIKSVSKLGIPLVHGAVHGWWGRVCVIKDDSVLEKLYPEGAKTPEVIPAIVPVVAIVAGYEVCEVIKILFGVGKSLVNRLMMIDTLEGEVYLIEL
ncbi:MAG: HesA/MoeB/ThiF family protein [Synergistetes bacterium]|nr:HesA/MoeB/ThiF family protein [Synergistota bacterium]MCX8128126.1 HesA/MoeB/ThiF family protein [Synergistota bacterium]MDW8192502.1 HesA/MoeB/ThiF family protein [Synergistota bacterium]